MRCIIFQLHFDTIAILPWYSFVSLSFHCDFSESFVRYLVLWSRVFFYDVVAEFVFGALIELVESCKLQFLSFIF